MYFNILLKIQNIIGLHLAYLRINLENKKQFCHIDLLKRILYIKKNQFVLKWYPKLFQSQNNSFDIAKLLI